MSGGLTNPSNEAYPISTHPPQNFSPNPVNPDATAEHPRLTGGTTGVSPSSETRWIVFARTTTLLARAAAIDTGVAHVHDEVWPAIQEMKGCVGLSVLADRASGRCIITSAWDDADAMRDSEELAAQIRRRLRDEFESGAGEVEEWEIAYLYRDHPVPEGACVRVSWLAMPSERLDVGVEQLRSTAIPEVENVEGFCNSGVMIDRDGGRIVLTVTFDSQDAARRSRGQGSVIRRFSSEEAGMRIVDVKEFELPLAHLRVPESM